MKIEINLKNLP